MNARVIGMDHDRRPTLLLERGWRLIKSWVEESPGRRRCKPEWMIYILLLDDCPMIRKRRHIGDRSTPIWAAKRNVRPVGLEAELAIWPGEPVQVVRLAERRLAVEPTVGFDLGERATFGYPQHLIDQLAWAHLEATMVGADTP